MNTVTAADFTAETTFTLTQWSAFKERNPKGGMREFEALLRKEVEAMVQAEEAVLTTEGNTKGDHAEIKIAHISFAFDNVMMIKLLQSRGMLLTNGQSDKVT